MLSSRFQRGRLPLRCCKISVCNSAVAVSQGISELFSTGSHPQYPPQPSSRYAQRAPSKMPMPKKYQENSVQRRISFSHPALILPAQSAPNAMANGTTKPAYPMNKSGGWITM